MPPVDHDDVVNGLLQLGPPLIAARTPGKRVCLLAARVGIEVLRYFGLMPKPFPCRAVGMNDIAVDGLAKHQSWPEIFAAGGHSIGQAGSGVLPDGHWDGHLAVLIERYCVEDREEGALLVDLSLGDLNRPERGIHTAPLRATVPQRSVTRQERLFLPLAEGGIVMYERIPDTSWRDAPDWRESRRWNPIVAALIRELR
jgi:hypothetical protein